MESHRYHPSPGLSPKFYYVVDHESDANTYWDETTGLTAQDTSTGPSNEDELYKSVLDHFCLPTPSPYVPVLHRQHVDIGDLKEQVGKGILVLEIDVENKMPEAHIYPVRDLLAARKGEWAEDPREELWMKTYLILHRVPREAITVYTPKELLEKELEDTRQRLPAPYNESFEASLAPQAAEGGHLNQVQDAGSRKGKSKQMFKRLFGGKRQ